MGRVCVCVRRWVGRWVLGTCGCSRTPAAVVKIKDDDPRDSPQLCTSRCHGNHTCERSRQNARAHKVASSPMVCSFKRAPVQAAFAVLVTT